MHLPTATIRTQIMLPLRFADGFATTARVYSFDGLADGREHLALGLGDRAAAAVCVDTGAAPLVRVHSECFTGDVLESALCDCGTQLLDLLANFFGRKHSAWERAESSARDRRDG